MPQKEQSINLISTFFWSESEKHLIFAYSREKTRWRFLLEAFVEWLSLYMAFYRCDTNERFMNIIKCTHQCIRDAINLVPRQACQPPNAEKTDENEKNVEQNRHSTNKSSTEKRLSALHKKWWLSENNISGSVHSAFTWCTSIYLNFFFRARRA